MADDDVDRGQDDYNDDSDDDAEVVPKMISCVSMIYSLIPNAYCTAVIP